MIVALDIVRGLVCVVAASCTPFLIEAWKNDRLLAASLGSFLGGAVGVEMATLGTGLSRFTLGEVAMSTGTIAVAGAVSVDVWRNRKHDS